MPNQTYEEAAPNYPCYLCAVHKILSQTPSEFNNIMLWAAATLCFFGFLRYYDPSAPLNFSGISVDNSTMPSIIQVRIKASKPDSFRQGVNVHIGHTGSLNSQPYTITLSIIYSVDADLTTLHLP